MVQGHGRAHGQVAHAEVHHPITGGAQGQGHRIRQAIHQGAIAGQRHHEEAPGPIATGYQLTHPIAQHLIAELTGFPEAKPLGRDFHGLLKGGLEGRGGGGHRSGAANCQC